MAGSRHIPQSWAVPDPRKGSCNAGLHYPFFPATLLHSASHTLSTLCQLPHLAVKSSTPGQVQYHPSSHSHVKNCSLSLCSFSICLLSLHLKTLYGLSRGRGSFYDPDVPRYSVEAPRIFGWISEISKNDRSYFPVKPTLIWHPPPLSPRFCSGALPTPKSILALLFEASLHDSDAVVHMSSRATSFPDCWVFGVIRSYSPIHKIQCKIHRASW
jgi:hypothetical protein